MSLIAGNTASGGAVGGSGGPSGAAASEESVAKAGAHLKGRIFAAGASLALSLAFLVGGFALAFGQDELVAASLAMGSFLVVTLVAFLAEVIVEPSLEKVAQEREERRIEVERESMPSAGGLLTSRLALTGGADPTHPNVANARDPDLVPTAAGIVGAPKGRRLDVTLPEESTGGLGGRASAATLSEGPGGEAPGGRGRSPQDRLGVQGSGASEASQAPAGGASAGTNIEEGFQDLASLLQESSQPSPVPARRP